MLIEDVKRIVHELDQGQQLSSIGVELIDNELAILYMNSKKSEVRREPTLRLHTGKSYQPQGNKFLILLSFYVAHRPECPPQGPNPSWHMC